MNDAIFRFYAELNDFLPSSRRHRAFSHTFDGRVSIKDMIESLGVPHTEVEAIIVNAVAVPFGYLVRHNDDVHVYPISTPVDGVPLVPLRPPPPPEPRFVLDTHLGQLAVYLRMLGFDTLYRNDYPDDELARISSEESRLLFTRDRGLLKRSIVTYGYFIRETNPQRQITEVIRRYRLAGMVAPLRRCISCNGMLQHVCKDDISHRLAAKTREYYDEFSACDTCSKIYWKGSHYNQMHRFLETVLQQT